MSEIDWEVGQASEGIGEFSEDEPYLNRFSKMTERDESECWIRMRYIFNDEVLMRRKKE